MNHGKHLIKSRLNDSIATLLRAGVCLAALVVLAGGVLYLLKYGAVPIGFHLFHGEPESLIHFKEILFGALHLHGRAIIQLGLLLLIATPIARVLFSAVTFARQRDYTYVLITLIVLALLALSLSGIPGTGK